MISWKSAKSPSHCKGVESGMATLYNGCYVAPQTPHLDIHQQQEADYFGAKVPGLVWPGSENLPRCD